MTAPFLRQESPDPGTSGFYPASASIGAVDNRARDAHPHAAASGGRGHGRRGGGRGGRGGRGVRIPRGGRARARRRRRRGSRHRSSRNGHRGGLARGAARPPDGLVALQPPRPAATAATAVAAASTGVSMRAVAEATTALMPCRRGVGGGVRLPWWRPGGGRRHGRPWWGAVGPPMAGLPLASPFPPDGVALNRGWVTPDPAPRCQWFSPPLAGAPCRRCACARVGAACGGLPDGRHRRSVGTSPTHRARSGRPAGLCGGGPRSGAPRAASRTEASRVCARVQRNRRAAAAAHPRPRRRRRLGGGTARRQAPAPRATPTMGMRGLPLVHRTWERVRTGWGGVQSPARSSRWSAVHSRGLRGGICARAILLGSRGGRPVVWVRKG